MKTPEPVAGKEIEEAAKEAEDQEKARMQKDDVDQFGEVCRELDLAHSPPVLGAP